VQRRSIVSFPIAWVVAAVPAFGAGGTYQRLDLRDMQGDATSLAAQADGNALVVVVMKGHWCAVCRAQVQRFAPHRAKLTELHAKVIGLNADSFRANREVVRQQAMDFPLISDPEHELLDQLGLWLPQAQHPMPAIVVFDACGEERARIVGRAPADRPELRVLELLSEIRTDKCDKPRA